MKALIDDSFSENFFGNSDADTMSPHKKTSKSKPGVTTDEDEKGHSALKAISRRLTTKGQTNGKANWKF